MRLYWYIDSLQVDNASALITAAKNLMTAVVLTVKTCYVASTAVSCTYLSCSQLQRQIDIELVQHTVADLATASLCVFCIVPKHFELNFADCKNGWSHSCKYYCIYHHLQSTYLTFFTSLQSTYVLSVAVYQLQLTVSAISCILNHMPHMKPMQPLIVPVLAELEVPPPPTKEKK